MGSAEHYPPRDWPSGLVTYTARDANWRSWGLYAGFMALKRDIAEATTAVNREASEMAERLADDEWWSTDEPTPDLRHLWDTKPAMSAMKTCERPGCKRTFDAVFGQRYCSRECFHMDYARIRGRNLPKRWRAPDRPRKGSV